MNPLDHFVDTRSDLDLRSNSVSEQSANFKPNAKNPCKICKNSKNEAIKFCIECEQDLCYFCSRSHLNLKICANHKIVNKSKFNACFEEKSFSTLRILEQKCLDHQSKLMRLYCFDCNMLLCDICPPNSLHNVHKVIDTNIKDKGIAPQNIQRRLIDIKENIIRLKAIIENTNKEKEKFKHKLEKLNNKIMENQADFNGQTLLQSQLEELLENGSEINKIIIDELSIIPHFDNEFNITFNENENFQFLEDNFMMKMTPKNLTIEPILISQQTLSELIQIKQSFDKYNDLDTHMAHRRINPYELIRSGPFINRSAMKMANIDADFNYMFTLPENIDNSNFFFADICGGPGGFAEYVIWRRKSRGLGVQGFGITLNDPGKNYRMEKYSDNFSFINGNILFNENIEDFKKLIMSKTEGNKVHFAMADGGFELEKSDYINQEILYNHIILSQILIALQVLRIGGHFITNIFDIFTPFTANLVYLLHLSFKNIKIIKPVTCRPANSERFIVCTHLKDNFETYSNFLAKVNHEMTQCFPTAIESDQTISELMPFEAMSEDFVKSLISSNETIATRQIVNLKNIIPSINKNDQFDSIHADLSSRCMREWEIPEILYNIDQNCITDEPKLSIDFSLINL